MDQPTIIDLTDATTGTDRLLADLGPDVAAHVHRVARSRVAARLAATAAVVAVAGAVAAPAQAAPVPVSQPVQVTISGPTATLRAVVQAPAKLLGSHCVAVSAPTPQGGQVRVGAWCSGTATVVVTVTMAAARFKPGPSVWKVRDLGDGKLADLAVITRQQSRFTSANIVPTGMGAVWVDTHLSHYKASTGRHVSSQQSPVWLQIRQGGAWVTVMRMVTDSTGRVEGLAAAPAGLHTYRLVRPAGSTVTDAATRPVAVDGSDVWDW